MENDITADLTVVRLALPTQRSMAAETAADVSYCKKRQGPLWPFGMISIFCFRILHFCVPWFKQKLFVVKSGVWPGRVLTTSRSGWVRIAVSGHWMITTIVSKLSPSSRVSCSHGSHQMETRILDLLYNFSFRAGVNIFLMEYVIFTVCVSSLSWKKQCSCAFRRCRWKNSFRVHFVDVVGKTVLMCISSMSWNIYMFVCVSSFSQKTHTRFQFCFVSIFKILYNSTKAGWQCHLIWPRAEHTWKRMHLDLSILIPCAAVTVTDDWPRAEHSEKAMHFWFDTSALT